MDKNNQNRTRSTKKYPISDSEFHYGTILKIILMEINLTQERLSEKTGINDSTKFSRIINPQAGIDGKIDGKYEPTPTICKKVWDYLTKLPSDDFTKIMTRIDKQMKSAKVNVHISLVKIDDKIRFLAEAIVLAMAAYKKDFKKLIGVPALPKNYLVRSDYINSIKKEILEHKQVGIINQPSILGIHGMGGIGKTVLATAVAQDEEIRQEFSDGVYWVMLGKQADIVEKQRIIFRESNVLPQHFTDVEGGKIELQKFFSDKKCLVILDDVWEVGQIKAFNVLDNKSCILITSRLKSVIDAFYGQTISIDIVNMNEAKEILSKSAEQSIEELPPFVEKIIKKCGSIMLALCIVGTQIRLKFDKNKGWENVLKKLEDKEKDFKSFVSESLDYQYRHLDAAIQIGLDNLDEEIRELYYNFAVFPEDAVIPEKVLQTFWKDKVKDYDFEEYLETLVQHSLLIKKEQESYLIHDLLHNYLVKKLGVDISVRQRYFISSYEKLIGNKQWNNGPNDGYFFQWLPWHLKQAGFHEELNDLLWNPQWYRSKIKNVDVFALISDLEYGQKELDLNNGEEIELVIQALYLSSYIIDKDLSELESQLTGRLIGFKNGKIQSLLKEMAKSKNTKWLRPLTPSLIHPGGHLLRTLTNCNSNDVEYLAITKDGKAVSTFWDGDGTLKVWDIDTGKELFTIEDEELSHVAAVTWDGKPVSVFWDGTLKVWDISTGGELCKFTIKDPSQKNQSVERIAVTAEGKVISAYSDFTLKVWDLNNGNELCSLEGHSEFINNILIVNNSKIVSTTQSDLKVWDIDSGRELFADKNPSRIIMCVEVTKAGLVVYTYDNAIKVWDISTCTELFSLEGHSDTVYHVSVTADDKIFSAAYDRVVKIWDISTGKELQTLDLNLFGGEFPSFMNAGGRIFFSDRYGELKVFCNDTMVISLGKHIGYVNFIAASDDGKVVSASDRLSVWDINISHDMELLEHKAPFYANHIALTQDGRVIAASFDKTLKIWDISTTTELLERKGHSDWLCYVAFAEGNKVIVASGDGLIKVWNINTGTELFTVHGHSNKVFYIAIAAGGKAVSVSKDKIKVWDIGTGTEFFTQEFPNDEIYHAVVSAEGKVIYVLNNKRLYNNDKVLYVLDICSGKDLFSLHAHTDSIYDIAVTEDGKVVSASRDNTLKVWDISTGTELHTLEGHSSAVQCVAITIDGKAISASSDNTLKIWDIDTGTELFTLQGHNDVVYYVTVTTDGKVISVSRDYTLKVWDIATKEELVTYNGDFRFECAYINENKNILIAVDYHGYVHFLKMEHF